LEEDLLETEQGCEYMLVDGVLRMIGSRAKWQLQEPGGPFHLLEAAGLQVTETKQYMQGPCMYMYMHAGTEGPAPRLVAPSDPVRRKAAARPMAGGLSAMEPGSQVHRVLGTPSGCCSMRSGTSTAPSSL
jgi:hypothetical protein